MSGFDENPFGEPTIDNPFADPSVTQVTKQTTDAHKGLEDYNPFADQAPQRGNAAQPVRGAANPPFQPSSQPAIMQPTQELPPPPSYARSAQQTQPQPQQLSAAEFQRRQEELERKAAELARREEELRNAPYNVRRNNWPPLPENNCFNLQPCFYQDINVDIPPEFQPIVRNLYYLWMFHASLLVINVFGALMLFLHDLSQVSTLGVGILYTIMLTPFSFLCWYRPAYKAFRSDSSFNFMVFFFIFCFQLIITIFQALGYAGTCGLILAIETMSDGTRTGIAIGIFLLLVGGGFCIAAFIDFLLLAKVHRIYRSSGASFAKAQQEFTSEIMRNQHVRDAAGNVVSAAVQSQFNQQQQRPPSSRY